MECSARVAVPTYAGLRALGSPRCDADGYEAWLNTVNGVAQFLSRRSRETQLVAALPLPLDDGQTRIDRARVLASRRQLPRMADELGTVFVQLVYPWLRTREAAALPGGLESPDGALAGLIAARALATGAWRSVARETPAGVLSVEPVLTRTELAQRERVSVFGPTPRGIELLSDVTTATDEAWRPAAVNRLMNILVRTAREAGEALAFERNGERLWTRLREAVGERLGQLWAAGALGGDTRADAYEVRCDRTTMTQAQMDAGQAVVRVEFTAARPIERIQVVLALSDGGGLSLVSREAIPRQNAEVPA